MDYYIDFLYESDNEKEVSNQITTSKTELNKSRMKEIKKGKEKEDKGEDNSLYNSSNNILYDPLYNIPCVENFVETFNNEYGYKNKKILPSSLPSNMCKINITTNIKNNQYRTNNGYTLLNNNFSTEENIIPNTSIIDKIFNFKEKIKSWINNRSTFIFILFTFSYYAFVIWVWTR